MVLFPLALGVRPASGAGTASVSKQKSWAEKAHKRDNYTCRFCGFRSPHYQRVIPWADAGDPPVATVCIFCEQCLNLERAGVTGAGLLLWLPEIGQADLNHLARAMYIARLDKGAMAELATRALDALTVRRAEAKKRLNSDDPMLLATIMRESLSAQDLKEAARKIDGIRLLPGEKYMMRGSKGDADQFPHIAQHWMSASGPFGVWPTSQWQETLQRVMASVGNA